MSRKNPRSTEGDSDRTKAACVGGKTQRASPGGSDAHAA